MSALQPLDFLRTWYNMTIFKACTGHRQIKMEEKDMILKNKYPVCEFDTGKNPMIQQADFLAESLPERGFRLQQERHGRAMPYTEKLRI